MTNPAPPTVEQTLEALDVPRSDQVMQRMTTIGGDDIWRRGDRLLTAAIAKEIWREWRPGDGRGLEDPTYVEHFRRFLADGLELGYRLGRFREAASRLPEPDRGARNWISCFEDAIANEECGRVRLFLSREQHQAFRASTGTGGQTWDDMLATMRDGLFYELGLVLRPFVTLVDDALPSPWLRCEWNDLRLPSRRGIDDHSVLVNDTVDRLMLLNIKGEHAVNPANRNECAIIEKSYEAVAKAAGLTTWDSRGYAVLALSAAIREAAGALVTRSLYELYSVRLRDYSPDFASVLHGAMDPDFVLQILRKLLAEEISVRDLPLILGAVLELRSIVPADLARYIVFLPATGGTLVGWSETAVSALLPADYVEFVRWSLKRYISHKYTRGQNTLIVYLLDPELEGLLARRDALDDAAHGAILGAVRKEVGSLPPTAQNPVLLTTADVRLTLRRLLAADLPGLAVLSYQELSPDMNIQPIARIALERR